MLKIIERGARKISALKTVFNASHTLGFGVVYDKLGNFLDRLDEFNESVLKEDPLIKRVFGEFAAGKIVDFEDGPKNWDDYFGIINGALTDCEKVALALKNEGKTQSLGRVRYAAQMMEQYYQKQDDRVKDVLNACCNSDLVKRTIYDLLPKQQNLIVHNGKAYVLDK
jgi:hypothetical protein